MRSSSDVESGEKEMRKRKEEKEIEELVDFRERIENFRVRN